MKTITGYKFITSRMKSKEGNCKWRIGEWKKHKGELELCKSGLHACRTPLQSLEYIYGDRWFVVEAKGKLKEEKGNKFVSSEMRLVKELPVKKISVEFAVKCAERCIKNFEKKYPKDKRPRQAIEAAQNWINNPTKENQEKAEEAKLAAWSAASAARSAASAAWSAGSAASAVWSAAELATAKKWQERILIKIIEKNLEV